MPELRLEYEKTFADNPPEFVYFNWYLMSQSHQTPFLRELFNNQYTNIKTLEEAESYLYIRNDLVDRVETRGVQLESFGYKI